LLEISENSYLITTDVRLPIFGRPFQPIERTKTSISKRGYLLKLHPEYTNKKRRKNMMDQTVTKNLHLKINSDIAQEVASSALPSKNIVYEKVRIKQDAEMVH
jgi:hypothetical protein